jgi:hypothetical protein
MFPKGDRWPGIRHLHGLLAAIGGEAQRQRAVEKKAGDGFPASTDQARAGGAKNTAGPAAENHWSSKNGQLTLVADLRRGCHLIEEVFGAMVVGFVLPGRLLFTDLVVVARARDLGNKLTYHARPTG